MKKFSIPCNFNGVQAPFTVYIGAPEPGHHPLHFQANWLSKERGGVIPQEIMDSVAKLKELSDQNNATLEDLCVYVLGTAAQDVSSSQETEIDDDELADDESDEEDSAEEEYEEEQTE